MTSTMLPPAPAPTTPAPTAPALNPVQQQTLDRLLDIRGERPYARAGLVEDLRAHLEAGTRAAVVGWHERTLFISKAQLANVLRCEGSYKHGKEQPRTPGLIPAVAAGTVVHRALQHCYTHPHVPVEVNVRAAVAESARSDVEFDGFWCGLDVAAQSDLIVNATNTVTSFLDSWPPVQTAWSPRFELGMQGRVGGLVLSGRADLVLGRPRPDGKQTMVVIDWKSGTLYPEHEGEADFYALLATLRFGVPPFRCFLYSLASTETTALDVDEARLFAAADAVIKAANAIAEVMGGTRLPLLSPSPACSWCPGRATCPALTAAAPPA